MNLRWEFILAIKAIIDASRCICEIYSKDFESFSKTDGSPVTIADFKSSEIISSYLKDTNIPCTNEEEKTTPYSQRKLWTTSWCIDPLDGTKEFVHKNDEFAVNIALIENGNPVFGLIANPLQETILFGEKNIGVYLFQFNDNASPHKWEKIIPQNFTDSLTVIGSRSHHSDFSNDLLNKLLKIDPDFRSLKRGSSLKFFDLALGNAQIYPRFSPTMEWDIASGQAILEALGGDVIDAKTGLSLTYNTESLINPSFIARSPSIISKF